MIRETVNLNLEFAGAPNDGFEAGRSGCVDFPASAEAYGESQ